MGVGDECLYMVTEGYWEYQRLIGAFIVGQSPKRYQISIPRKNAPPLTKWVNKASLRPVPTLQQMMNEFMAIG